MIKAKKTLILLVTLFIVLITVFTTIRFRTVKNFTKVYTYPEWKLNSNNGLRIAFLEFMNRKSFLSFSLDLNIIDSKGKKLNLDKTKQSPRLYNKEFYIKELSLGAAFIEGELRHDGKIVHKFKIPIDIVDEFKINKIKVAPIIATELTSDFDKEEKIHTYPRFMPSDESKLEIEDSNKTKNKDKLMIQLFGYPINLAFSEKNKIFLLITQKDYSPISLKANLNIKDFFAKRKNIEIETDENGLASFNEYIYRADGEMILKIDNQKDKKIPFELSTVKTSVFTDKEIYNVNEKIKVKVKTYKKIDSLFLNVIIGKSWIKNKEIKIIKNKHEFEFSPPKGFSGFIEFNVHKGYSYLKDYSYRKIYIGSKNDLKSKLFQLNQGFINKVINKSTDNDDFYSLIISQLDHSEIGISKVFDSYKSQQKRLDNDREKYQSIVWNLLLLISLLIIGIIFFTSFNEIKKSQESVDFQYRKKGGMFYLFIFISILSAFIGLILWVLRIV